MLALSLAGCSPGAKDAAPSEAKDAAKPGEKAAAEPTVKRDDRGNVTVRVAADIQKLMGLKTMPLTPARLAPEVKGYARVLDITSLTMAATDLASAKPAAAASQAELGRLKTLAGQNNASERALQTAGAAAAKDEMQITSARLRLLSAWGAAIAERAEQPAFIQALTSLSNVLAQVEVPAGESLKGLPTSARLIPLNGSSPVDAVFLGQAPAVDPGMQGRGFLFLVASNTVGLTPGAACGALLFFPGEPKDGIAIPAEAIVRQNGAAWVYVQVAEDQFARRAAPLDFPLPDGRFWSAEFRPEDKVVTTGAQELLSEELKGQGGEE